ncbi:hypothetical protein B0H13DRAFT_2309724 [Mycena leptocephala]|nr:hypothetical protein B0H13DRAFT_2309724 [Mycena leptocephala]
MFAKLQRFEMASLSAQPHIHMNRQSKCVPREPANVLAGNTHSLAGVIGASMVPEEYALSHRPNLPTTFRLGDWICRSQKWFVAPKSSVGRNLLHRRIGSSESQNTNLLRTHAEVLSATAGTAASQTSPSNTPVSSSPPQRRKKRRASSSPVATGRKPRKRNADVGSDIAAALEHMASSFQVVGSPESAYTTAYCAARDKKRRTAFIQRMLKAADDNE